MLWGKLPVIPRASPITSSAPFLTLSIRSGGCAGHDPDQHSSGGRTHTTPTHQTPPVSWPLSSPVTLGTPTSPGNI
jgi:hypothetical protein